MTFGTFDDPRRRAQYVQSCSSALVFANIEGNAMPQMIYEVVLAALWSAVGALVFLERTNMSLPQRLGLTIATSLVFGVVGWIDVSSILHTIRADPAVIADGAVRPD